MTDNCNLRPSPFLVFSDLSLIPHPLPPLLPQNHCNGLGYGRLLSASVDCPVYLGFGERLTATGLLTCHRPSSPQGGP